LTFAWFVDQGYTFDYSDASKSSWVNKAALGANTSARMASY